SAGQRGERNDVYLHDPIVPLQIARGKRSVVAEAGVIDQQVDVDLFLLEPLRQLLALRLVAKIDNAHVHEEVWIAREHFVAQLVEPVAAARHEHEPARTSRELPDKLAPESRGSAGDEGETAVELHFFS